MSARNSCLKESPGSRGRAHQARTDSSPLDIENLLLSGVEISVATALPHLGTENPGSRLERQCLRCFRKRADSPRAKLPGHLPAASPTPCPQTHTKRRPAPDESTFAGETIVQPAAAHSVSPRSCYRCVPVSPSARKTESPSTPVGTGFSGL